VSTPQRWIVSIRQSAAVLTVSPPLGCPRENVAGFPWPGAGCPRMFWSD